MTSTDANVAFLEALNAGKYDADLNAPVRLIPHEGRMLGEVRRIDFVKAHGIQPQPSRVISFGRCNMQCPYCFRDAQFVDEEYNVANTVEVKLGSILALIKPAIALGETIRLSGGDPCLYPKVSEFIARYVVANNGSVSYCHNGTAPGFVRRLLPFASSAAIDVKSLNEQDFIHRTGVDERRARIFMQSSLECIETLTNAGVLTEVRTTIFSDTRTSDLETIADQISRRAGDGTLFWTLRNFESVSDLDWGPMPVRKVIDLSDYLSRRHPNLYIGFRRNWDDGKLRYVRAGLQFID